MAELERGEILVLGAEHQAATSLALAYPERRFVFVSDCPVVDGWDLPNVRMLPMNPAEANGRWDGVDQVVPLSPRWLADTEATALSTVLPRIEAALPGLTLPVASHAMVAPSLIVKGDRWHRSDAPLFGSPSALADLSDTHGCGLVYQERIDAAAPLMSIGRRGPGSATMLGVFRGFRERYFRIDVLQAAESVDEPGIAALTCAALDALGFSGWFTFNWLPTPGGPRLSSFRPVPKAAFTAFRKGGTDLLAREPKDACLAPGIRLIAMPHYAKFDWLVPR